MVLEKNLQDRNYRHFTDIGESETAARVLNSTLSSNQLSVTQNVTFTVGTTSVTGVIGLDKAPIFDANGTHLASINSTSFLWTTGTTCGTLVAFKKDLSDTEQLALLNIGEYAIDYDTGKIRYRKGNAATTGACSYTTRQLNVELTAGTSTVTIGQVEIKDAGSGVVMDVITQDSAFGTTTTGLAVFGKYEATPTTYTDGDAAPILLDVNGRVVLSSDIEIGAVEMKDGVSDNRAFIQSAGTSKTSLTNVLTTQHIDSTGSVMPAMNGSSNAGYVYLTDGTSKAALDGSQYQMMNISAQGLTAVKISKDSSANVVTNPVWVELTDGVAALGTVSNPLNVTTEASQGNLPQSVMTLSTGSANYITCGTSTGTRNHATIILESGTGAAIVSLNSGSTDHLYIPQNSISSYDDLLISNGATIRVKNAVSADAHGTIYVTLW